MNKILHKFMAFWCVFSCALILLSTSMKEAVCRIEAKARKDKEPARKRSLSKRRVKNPKKHHPRLNSLTQTNAKSTKLQVEEPRTKEEYRLVRAVNSLERRLDRIDAKIESFRKKLKQKRIFHFTFLYLTQPYYEKKGEIKMEISRLKRKIREIQKTSKEVAKETSKVTKF